MIKRLIPSLIAILCLARTAPAGPLIYVADSANRLETVTPSTGAITTIGTMSSQMLDIALRGDGKLFGVGNVGGTQRLVTINTATAAITTIGNLGATINSLSFRGDGTLFGAGGTTLYVINTATGAATTVGNIGFESAGDMAFDQNGKLYLTTNSVAGNFNSTSDLVSVDQNTGAGTLIGSTGFQSVYALADAGGVLFGFSGSTNQIFTINTTTGAGSAAQNLNPSVSPYGAASNPAITPAPASLLLFGSGLIGWCGYRWRRRRLRVPQSADVD